MSKTIGIATIALIGSSNYGNRLQAYALQEFLRQHGYSPLTIYYESDYVRKRPSVRESKLRKALSQPVDQTADDCLRIVKKRLFRWKLRRLEKERKAGFEEFAKQHIVYTEKCYYSYSDFSEIEKQCVCFITGSDQIWNPYYEGSDGFAYLDFAQPGKRISYAPSIAVEQIPFEMKQRMDNWLHGMDFLSVRECAGRDLLERNFGLRAKVVCDPVLLLTKEQWRTIAVPAKIEKRYFAVYILGKKTLWKKKILRSLRAKYGITSVDIYTVDDPLSAFASPQEFLGLIDGAEFVVTDSFHGLVFSMIFEKPIVILPRCSQDKVDSRLGEILELFGINEYVQQLQCGEYDIIYPDYRAAEADVAALIKESGDYLLKGIDRCIS